MTVVWIRHGLKQYDNGKGSPGCFQHDPELVPGQEKRIAQVRDHLIAAYGNPTEIITSPYLRTASTAVLLDLGDLILRSPLGLFGITVDYTIAEFLGYQRGEKPNVHPSIQRRCLPPCGESMEALIERCQKHLDSLMYRDVTWVVTHGIVMQKIHKLLIQKGVKRMFNPKTDFHELDAIALHENKLYYYPAPPKDDVAHGPVLDYRSRCGCDGSMFSSVFFEEKMPTEEASADT